MFKKNKLNQIFNKEEIIYFRLILISNSFMFFLEGASLLSIPLFASILIDSNFLFEKIIFFERYSYLANISHKNLIIISGILVIISFVIKNVFLILLTLFQGKFQKKIKSNLASQLFNYYINLPYLDHLEKNPASLSRYVSSEISNLNTYLVNLVLNFREVMTICVIFILIVIFSPKVILLIFFGLGIFGILFLKIIKSFIKLRANNNIKLGKNLTQTIYEAFGSIKDLKIQMKETDVIKYFNKDVNEFENNNYYFYVIEKLPRIILEFLAIAILVLCSFFFIKDGNKIIEILPSLSLILISTFRFLPAFNAVTVSNYYMKLTKPSLKIIAGEIIKSRNLTVEKIFFDKNLENTLDKSKYIEVKNLSFRYSSSKKETLNNINFEIEKGDFIGITGRTGTGKSTLFHILMGLIQPQKGIVSNYGKDINHDIKFWKKKIGFVSQNIFLFNGSIKKNILLDLNENLDVDFGRLDFSIELSELKQKIDNLPDGLNTHVGINGSKLSGGEKQRLAIARILYQNPEIIFMDESTNALDEKTENKILDNLRSTNLKDKTILIISHRKNTLNKCDKILTLDNGEIRIN